MPKQRQEYLQSLPKALPTPALLDKGTLLLLVSNLIDEKVCLTDLYYVDKNSKEAFLKKLQICMKHYDYKDETKDVRGKVTKSIDWNKLGKLTCIDIDREIERH